MKPQIGDKCFVDNPNHEINWREMVCANPYELNYGEIVDINSHGVDVLIKKGVNVGITITKKYNTPSCYPFSAYEFDIKHIITVLERNLKYYETIKKECKQMDNGYILKYLCGEHYLSGVEMSSEEVVYSSGEKENVNILLFIIDGNVYKMTENPDDGWRSYCGRIEIVDTKLKNTFPAIKVVCHMMEDSYGEKNECIVMRDAKNGKIILEAGTKNTDDYYPYCHFEYTPENMSCNQNK